MRPGASPNRLDANREPANVVVLGIGNLLRSDEGLGIHVLRRLFEHPHLPSRVRLLDGGVLGPELLAYVAACDALLIVDAVDAGRPPGELVRLEGDAIPAAWEQKLSMHQAGVSELLGILRMQESLPARLVLWGAQPASLEWGVELSQVVARTIDALLDRILNELRTWGVSLDHAPLTTPGKSCAAGTSSSSSSLRP